MKQEALEKRFLWIYFFLAALFVVIFAQLIHLQILGRQEFKNYALRQHNLLIDLPAKRGNLYDRHGKELAVSLKVPSVYAVPRVIPNAEKMPLSQKLSAILGMPAETIYKKLDTDKAFIWIKRRVSQEEAKKIQEMQDTAFGFIYENKRFYPHQELAAQVAGFVNIDGKGMEGIELQYNKYLEGEPGYRLTIRDALGRDLPALDQKNLNPVDGASITLTIDHYIQYLTEQALDTAFKKWKALGAMAIVMDPMTGEILAMASRPTYDPQDVAKYPPEARRNRNITDFYEPGSSFKAITITAALNEGTFKRDDTIFCENGAWKAGPKVLHDVHSYGDLTFDQVFAKSSNIGTVKIARQVGQDKFYHYVRAFGFGRLTGFGFPGEVMGKLSPPSKWSKISMNAIPIGQEIAVTPLQLLRAYSAIANGGYLVKPYVVSEIRDSQGVVLKKFNPRISTEPIMRREVAESVKEILGKVVTEGTGKTAAIPGISVAGKTGTSQKVDPKGGYSHSHFMATFVGFAPLENPRLAMVVVFDDPRPLYYGVTVSGPVFKDVIEKSLLYLGIVPKEDPSQKSKAA
jgi:cell division protein FtsI (penicillin-binding protein 3)